MFLYCFGYQFDEKQTAKKEFSTFTAQHNGRPKGLKAESVSRFSTNLDPCRILLVHPRTPRTPFNLKELSSCVKWERSKRASRCRTDSRSASCHIRLSASRHTLLTMCSVTLLLVCVRINMASHITAQAAKTKEKGQCIYFDLSSAPADNKHSPVVKQRQGEARNEKIIRSCSGQIPRPFLKVKDEI